MKDKLREGGRRRGWLLIIKSATYDDWWMAASHVHHQRQLIEKTGLRVWRERCLQSELVWVCADWVGVWAWQVGCDHFLVRRSVPSRSILYFSLALSVSTLILASISRELSMSFSLAAVNSRMVESLSLRRKLGEGGLYARPRGTQMERLPPMRSSCFMVSSFFLMVLLSSAREFSQILACSAALRISFSISLSWVAAGVPRGRAAPAPSKYGSCSTIFNHPHPPQPPLLLLRPGCACRLYLLRMSCCCCGLVGCLVDCVCCECNKFVFPAPRECEYQVGDVVCEDDVVRWEFHSFASVPPAAQQSRTVPYLEVSSAASRTRKQCFIYFHGNGEDVGLLGYFLEPLVKALGVSFYAIEYPSYGHYYSLCPVFISKKIKEDALNFYEHVRVQMDRDRRDIMVFGRSIGSGPACYLAGRREVGALVLMSPFDTVKRVAVAHFGCAGVLVKQHFNNEEELARFQGRLLVIHGQRDQIIHIRHSRALVAHYHTTNDYKNKATVVEPEYMTHNHFDTKKDVIAPLHDFLNTVQQ